MKFDFSIDNYQAILFDFDGVLCECMDVKTQAFIELFQSYGEDVVKKVVKHHIENGGISRYGKIGYYYKEFLKSPITQEEVNKIAENFSKLVVKKVIASDWVGGAKEFLEKNYEKLDLFVVSGTPQEELDFVVIKRGMRKYFKGIYGTPDTKPIIAKKIKKENEYSFNKLLYIGDSLSDYLDAKKVGVNFLGRVQKGMKSIFPDKTPIFSDFNDLL